MTKGIAATETLFLPPGVFGCGAGGRGGAVLCRGRGASRSVVAVRAVGLRWRWRGWSMGLWGVMPDVPYLCDFARSIVVATRDPYLEIARYLSVHRDKAEVALQTLSYFDGVHFAARATAPALFSVALMDTICPPSIGLRGLSTPMSGPRRWRSIPITTTRAAGRFRSGGRGSGWRGEASLRPVVGRRAAGSPLPESVRGQKYRRPQST